MATVARVLAIDDELGMRAGIERALRHFVVRMPSFDEEISLEIETAETGEEGIDKIGSFKPDIILLDHKLPGISGLEVLDWIHDHDHELDMLVVMITAYASLDTAIKATKKGAYDFLAKPFSPMELKSAVRKATKHLTVRRKARELAAEKRQVRFQFISVLAHELKAPLGAIEGFLQIVEDKTAGEDPAVYDELVERSLVRVRGMRKLIYDLLDLTRIESGNKQRELGDVDVLEAARHAIENMAPEAEKRGITVELHGPESVPMHADMGELEIIFNNLISNAVKYNRDEGRVDVRVEPSEGRIRISVADTGIGMSEEDVGRLFGDFVRIKNAKTRGILGSGLGLSIMKKLVDLYGGEIKVTSKPDEGTTFTVILDPNAEPVGPERMDDLQQEVANAAATLAAREDS